MRAKHYIDEQMRLQAGSVHVWRADLDAVGLRVGWLLDERELERAARIVRVPARERWMAARGLLRMLLGAYLEEHPRTVRFAEGTNGKPLLDLPSETQLCFNLSHSAGLALYALTEMCAVGVDVELVDTRSSSRPKERGSSRRPGGRDFLRAWVRGEAEGKCLGTGVRNKPISTLPDDSRTWVTDLDLGGDAVGALALTRKPVDFRVYEIDFSACGFILPTGNRNCRRPRLSERNVSN